MIFGIIVGVLGARALGQSSIVGFIVGVVIGIGCGLAAERTYTALTGSGDKDQKPPPDKPQWP
jgi:uncharacterized membrane protein YeaQ/YmgE (transglycosylase-associated protein family)